MSRWLALLPPSPPGGDVSPPSVPVSPLSPSTSGQIGVAEAELVGDNDADAELLELELEPKLGVAEPLVVRVLVAAAHKLHVREGLTVVTTAGGDPVAGCGDRDALKEATPVRGLQVGLLVGDALVEGSWKENK